MLFEDWLFSIVARCLVATAQIAVNHLPGSEVSATNESFIAASAQTERPLFLAIDRLPLFPPLSPRRVERNEVKRDGEEAGGTGAQISGVLGER